MIVYGVFTVYEDPDSNTCWGFCGIGETRAVAEGMADTALEIHVKKLKETRQRSIARYKDHESYALPHFQRAPDEEVYITIVRHGVYGEMPRPWYPWARIVKLHCGLLVDIK